MKRTRVVLADDHTMMLEALEILLKPEFDIVGTFADGLALVEAAPGLAPNVVVLDISMPKLNGLLAGQKLKQLLPSVKLIYLTMNHNPDIAAEAFRGGASAYLLKNSAAAELPRAINEVVRGGSYVTPLMMSSVENMIGSAIRIFKDRKEPYQLTLRQREVLQLLAEGRSMKEAAYILKISTRTVAFHKYSMMEHLQVKTNAELLQYAMKSSVMSA